MKCQPFPSEIARALRLENEALKLKNARLETELAATQPEIEKLKRLCYGRMHIKTQLNKESKALPRKNAETTSAGQDDWAFERRATKVSAKVSLAGYSQSTEASRLREGNDYRSVNSTSDWSSDVPHNTPDWSSDVSYYEDRDEHEYGTTESDSASVLNTPPENHGPCDCCDCSRLLKGHDNRDHDDSLKTRSRLEDTEFYNMDPASRVRLPFDNQKRYLEEAQDAARATLWSALRKYWPEAQRKHYPEGPGQVRFGFCELKAAGFDTPSQPSEQNAMCELPPRLVCDHIFSVIDLRNAIAHAGKSLRTSEIDELMSRAQALSVLLLDEPRAMKVRKLRDQVQKAARSELKALDNLLSLEHIGRLRVWPYHHQEYFQDVLRDLRDEDNLRDFMYSASKAAHDPIAVRAANAWKMRCSRPGEQDPGHLEAVERKRKRFEDRQAVPSDRVRSASRSITGEADEGRDDGRDIAGGHGRRDSVREDAWDGGR